MGEATYYIRHRGRVAGPFTVAQLRAMHQRGQFGRAHEVSPDRQSWGPASALAEVFPPAAAPAEAAPATGVTTLPRARPDEGRWYYLDPAGDQRGPYSWRELEDFRDRGDVSGDTLVCSPGMSEWLTVDTVARRQRPREGRRKGADRDEEGGGPLDAGERLGWQRFRTGLTLLASGGFVWVGGLVLLLFGLLVSTFGLSPGGLMLTAVLVALVFLAGRVVEAIGAGFLAATPPACGPRGLAVAAFILVVAAVVLSVMQPVGSLMLAEMRTDSFHGALEASWGLALVIISALVMVLEAVRVVLLLAYLRAAGAAVAPALGRVYRYLLLAYAGSYLLGLLAFAFLLAVGLGAEAGPTREGSVLLVLLLVLGIILAVAAGGLFCFWLVRYLIALLQLRAAVSERLGRD